jgi:hypothetical protein
MAHIYWQVLETATVYLQAGQRLEQATAYMAIAAVVLQAMVSGRWRDLQMATVFIAKETVLATAGFLLRVAQVIRDTASMPMAVVQLDMECMRERQAWVMVYTHREMPVTAYTRKAMVPTTVSMPMAVPLDTASTPMAG